MKTKKRRTLGFQRLEDRRLLAVSAVAVTSHHAGRAGESGNADVQTVYLDADGADTAYRGPIQVDPLRVPAFSASRSGLAGSEQRIVERSLEILNYNFSRQGVRFTAIQPPANVAYSTVYVGGDDTPFESYGTFLGLAEKVDIGNEDRNDRAFIFPEEFDQTMTIDQYSSVLSDVIGHEVLHLLGHSHTHSVGQGLLAEVAYSQEVHVWLSGQGEELFRNEFGETSFTEHLNQFGQGAFDEDEAYRGQFGNTDDFDHPSIRHFWDPDGGFGDGLAAGYDSAINRAAEHVTGGVPITGISGDLFANLPNPEIKLRPWRGGEGAAARYETDTSTAFYYLGHASHLLQDMTLPAHVHKDPHLDRPTLFAAIGFDPLGNDFDPYHDWIDSVPFTTTPEVYDLEVERTAGFEDFESFIEPRKRYLDFKIPSLDAIKIRSAAEIDSEFRPGTTSVDLGGFIQLFKTTAEIADNFDSKDADGEGAFVNGGMGGFRGEGTLIGDDGSYNEWTRGELDTLGRVLIPRAITDVAELVSYFYGVVDQESPQIAFLAIDPHDPDAGDANIVPKVVSDPVITLRVATTDQGTGDTGIGKSTFKFEYRELLSDGVWGDWQGSNPDGRWLDWSDDTGSPSDASHFTANVNNPGEDFTGKPGAIAEASFKGESYRTYGFRATVKDGGGNEKTAEAYVKIEPKVVSVVQVIDRSTSMEDNRKIDSAKLSAELFISLLLENDRIGISSFAGDASTDFAIAEIQPANGDVQRRAKEAVRDITLTGEDDPLGRTPGTSIGSGLRDASNQLDMLQQQSGRAIVLLSDGMNNRFPDAQDVLDAIDDDIAVYTIGFGADAQSLSEIASDTGGVYYASGRLSNLQAIYAQIEGKLRGEQTVQRTSGIVMPGVPVELPFLVDATQESVTLVLTWPGSDLDLELMSPQGIRITSQDADDDESVEFIGGETFEVIRLRGPEIGQWQARVIPKVVDPLGEPFVVLTQSETSIVAVPTSAQVVDMGDFVRMAVSVQDTGPIRGATVAAEITAPEIFESGDVPNGNSFRAQSYVSENVMVEDINVRVQAFHPNLADLDIVLISPNGSRVTLASDRTGEVYANTLFDDDADQSLSNGSPDFDGSFRPEGSLARFDGLDAHGVWTLEITDDNSSIAGGRLNDWQLILNGEAVPHTQISNQHVALFDDGNHNDGDANDGVYANDIFLGGYAGAYDVQFHVDGSSNNQIRFVREPNQSIQYGETDSFLRDRGFLDNATGGRIEFGNVVVGSNAIARYRFQNFSDRNRLLLSGFSLPDGVTVVNSPPAALLPGEVAIFDLKLDTKVATALNGISSLSYSIELNGEPTLPVFVRVPIAGNVLSSEINVTTSDDESDGDISDGNLSLREAIQLVQQNAVKRIIRIDPLIFGETLTFDIGTGFTVPASGLQIEGSDSSSTLRILGDQVVLDLADSRVALTGFPNLDLSAPDVNVIRLNAQVLESLSPIRRKLLATLGEGDQLDLTDVDEWRMSAPSIGRDFLSTAINGNATIQAKVPHPWQNFLRASDISNDGTISARDALLIINELGFRRFSDDGTKNLDDPFTLSTWPNIYFDQNGDDRVTALDALRVINELARQSSSMTESEAEEVVSTPPFVPQLEYASTKPDINDELARSSLSDQPTARKVSAIPLTGFDQYARDKIVDEVIVDELFASDAKRSSDLIWESIVVAELSDERIKTA
ncbi:Proprotein convertase P-domain protein [Rubripirellula tenax]|uniref:Proprotein convertase P-domain protein n=1 Tax=Rubripirellula tenax TaxID=2528015 RepID=A0A5C6EF11_9BACT|nr:proprotein convertase P-domain-containing protein [Rubripirellula tenax]TWU46166.1 Proprotein convertase P-domain protein [Rubripirellula tenax]